MGLCMMHAAMLLDIRSIPMLTKLGHSLKVDVQVLACFTRLLHAHMQTQHACQPCNRQELPVTYFNARPLVKPDQMRA